MLINKLPPKFQPLLPAVERRILRLKKYQDNPDYSSNQNQRWHIQKNFYNDFKNRIAGTYVNDANDINEVASELLDDYRTKLKNNKPEGFSSAHLDEIVMECYEYIIDTANMLDLLRPVNNLDMEITDTLEKTFMGLYFPSAGPAILELINHEVR